ncbi:MAG: hypothetical protein LBU07_04200, partial [Coriobacteriales bacterium]|nr:hypothetical protein [Coriobacteriales bacterium]
LSPSLPAQSDTTDRSDVVSPQPEEPADTLSWALGLAAAGIVIASAVVLLVRRHTKKTCAAQQAPTKGEE